MVLVVAFGVVGLHRISTISVDISNRLLPRLQLAIDANSCVEEARVYAALAAIEPEPDRRAFYRQASIDQFDRAGERLRALAALPDGSGDERRAAALAGVVVDYARAALPPPDAAGASAPYGLGEVGRTLARIDVAQALRELVSAVEADIRRSSAEAWEVRTQTIGAVTLGAVVALGFAMALAVWMLRAQVAAPIAKIREYLLGLASVPSEGLGEPARPGKSLDALLTREIPLTDRRDDFGDIAQAMLLARVRVAAVVEDLARARESLIQQERMASLGRLMAGVAHEINTPIGVSITAASLIAEIAASIQASQGDSSQDSPAIQQLDRASALIMSNLERAGRLVQSFKQVSSEQHHEDPCALNLRDYVTSMIESLRPETAKHGCRIDLLEGEAIPLVTRPDAIWQIFSNIVLNAAIHAYEDASEGVIIVDVRRVGAQARIAVRDEGRGVSPEIQARIFDPFFTTRRKGGGAGLGLAIAYNLTTEVLKGQLSVVSQVGAGATFTIEFPLSAETGDAR